MQINSVLVAEHWLLPGMYDESSLMISEEHALVDLRLINSQQT
jgi:hypothetical protein